MTNLFLELSAASCHCCIVSGDAMSVATRRLTALNFSRFASCAGDGSPVGPAFFHAKLRLPCFL